MHAEDITLVVDTAGQVLSVAVVCGPKVLACNQETLWRGMAARLQPVIIQTLEDSNLTLKDLKALCVNLGPGSFTSIRIGVAAVQALGFALDIPVYGASGFAAMAHPFLGKGQPVGVWLEAVGEDIYHQYFDEKGIALTAPAAAPMAKALENCPDKALVVGYIPTDVNVLPSSKVKPCSVCQPEALYAVAENGLSPLYVRPLAYHKAKKPIFS